MPTKYEAITNHVQVDVNPLALSFDAFLSQNLAELAVLGNARNANFETDDFEALQREYRRRMLVFAMECKSRPVRSKNEVIATLREIAKDPLKFVRDPFAYDPEAVQSFFVALKRLSPQHAKMADNFYIGQGILEPEAVKVAAVAAIVGYDQWHKASRGNKGTGGAPRNELLRKFAELAKDLFMMVGGRPTSTDQGNFRKFVDLLRIPFQGIAREAGFALTPISIIRLAAKLDSTNT